MIKPSYRKSKLTQAMYLKSQSLKSLPKFICIVLICGLSVISCNSPKESKTIISTDRAPVAIGPYSQGVLVGNTLYAAGQIGLNPLTNELAGPDLESQTIQTLDNPKAVVEAANLTLRHVVEVQVFLSDLNDYSNFNDIYEKYFPNDPPVRAVIEASALPLDAKVEVRLTAVNIE